MHFHLATFAAAQEHRLVPAGNSGPLPGNRCGPEEQLRRSWDSLEPKNPLPSEGAHLARQWLPRFGYANQQGVRWQWGIGRKRFSLGDENQTVAKADAAACVFPGIYLGYELPPPGRKPYVVPVANRKRRAQAFGTHGPQGHRAGLPVPGLAPRALVGHLAHPPGGKLAGGQVQQHVVPVGKPHQQRFHEGGASLRVQLHHVGEYHGRFVGTGRVVVPPHHAHRVGLGWPKPGAVEHLPHRF